MAVLWSKVTRPIMRRFRDKRVALLRATFPSVGNMRVLDLGGSRHFWSQALPTFPPRELVILNIVDDEQSGVGDPDADDRIKVEVYDGGRIPYEDGHFDLVLCNSVIEHVPLEGRTYLAKEIKRVGRAYFVQTPAQEFVVEPHFIAPFIHWLPRRAGRALAHLTPYALFAQNSAQTRAYFDEVTLLTRRGFQRLFSDAEYVPERFAGMTKSHMAIRRALDPDPAG